MQKIWLSARPKVSAYQLAYVSYTERCRTFEKNVNI